MSASPANDPWIGWVDEQSATGEVAEGFAEYFQHRPDRTQVAPIIKALSHRPDFMRLIMEVGWKLHFSDGHLTERVKELLATVVSSENQCGYCLHAHAFALQRQGTAEEVIAALGRGQIDEADIPESEKALLRFARLVTRESYRTTPAEIEQLRQAGWTEPQIAEAVYVIGMYAFYNRVANAFGLEDPQYFALHGRPDPLAGHLPRRTPPTAANETGTAS